MLGGRLLGRPWLTIRPCDGGTAWTPGLQGPSASLRFLLLEKCLKRATKRQLQEAARATGDRQTAMFSPLLLLIFVLQELFELLRVLHVGAAVCLGVERAEPRPPAHLNAHTRTQKQEVGFQTMKARTGLSRRIERKSQDADAAGRAPTGHPHPAITACESRLEECSKSTSACAAGENRPL